MFTEARQYLYPDMVFSCNGAVTKWIYGGIDHGRNPPNRLPELQIWRQMTNGYTKTGSSLVNTDTKIGTNLYEFIPQPSLKEICLVFIFLGLIQNFLCMSSKRVDHLIGIWDL